MILYKRITILECTSCGRTYEDNQRHACPGCGQACHQDADHQ